MAIGAGRGSGLVKQHEITGDRLLEGVAGGAGNILVAPFERKLRFLVIEKRWFPLVAVVADSTIVGARAELVGVRVFVAVAAGAGGAVEPDMQHGQFHVRGLVAIRAGHGTMGAQERELGPVVVELG